MSTRGVRCIYRTLAYFAGDRPITEILNEANVGGETEDSRKRYDRDLRKGVAKDVSAFEKIAAVVKCHARDLYFAPEQSLPRWDRPAYKFAARVATLIDNGIIPQWDEDKEEVTDVVSFAWTLGDPELDSFSLTFPEEREAYLILRDYLMKVVERPIETKRTRAKQIGKIEIATPRQNDVVADILARKAASLSAFSTSELKDSMLHNGLASTKRRNGGSTKQAKST